MCVSDSVGGVWIFRQQRRWPPIKRWGFFHMWRDSFVTHAYVTWCRIHMWQDSFMCDMTHSWLINMCRDAVFICGMTHSFLTWLIRVCHDSFVRDMRLSHMWHASFTRYMLHSYVTRLIHVWLDSFIRDMPHWYVTYHIYMWHDSHDSFVRVLNRRRSIQNDEFMIEYVHMYVM